MGNYLAEKRKEMEETQILNRIFGFKIEERKRTFFRVKLHQGCIHLPTYLSYKNTLSLHSKLKFPDFFCGKVMSALACSEGQQEWIYRREQLVLRHWCPHYTRFTDCLFLKLSYLWFHELIHFMNHIFQLHLKGIQLEHLGTIPWCKLEKK